MTHFEFLQLTDHEQYDVMLNKGRKVAERIDEANRYNLYQIDSFYVECKLEIEFRTVLALTSFSSTKPLDLYLNEIEIIGLF